MGQSMAKRCRARATVIAEFEPITLQHAVRASSTFRPPAEVASKRFALFWLAEPWPLFKR
jgi:hypothetical protein